MKAAVAAFNQEKALVGASVITNLQMDIFEAQAATPSTRQPYLHLARREERCNGQEN